MPNYTFTVNGSSVNVDAPGDLALLWVLRDKLGITGPKYGCGVNVCKACTCLVNGKAVPTCVTSVASVAGKKVTTIEGLANGDTLHPVQHGAPKQDEGERGKIGSTLRFFHAGKVFLVCNLPAHLLAGDASPEYGRGNQRVGYRVM